MIRSRQRAHLREAAYALREFEKRARTTAAKNSWPSTCGLPRGRSAGCWAASTLRTFWTSSSAISASENSSRKLTTTAVFHVKRSGWDAIFHVKTSDCRSSGPLDKLADWRQSDATTAYDVIVVGGGHAGCEAAAAARAWAPGCAGDPSLRDRRRHVVQSGNRRSRQRPSGPRDRRARRRSWAGPPTGRHPVPRAQPSQGSRGARPAGAGRPLALRGRRCSGAIERDQR